MTDAVKKMRDVAEEIRNAAPRTAVTEPAIIEAALTAWADKLSPLLAEVEIQIELLRGRLRTIGIAGEFGPTNGEVVARLRELEYTHDQARQYIQNAQEREHRITELEAEMAALKEHECLEVAAALDREAAYLITCNQETAADVIRHRIPPADRSVLDAHDEEVRDRALEEAAIEAYAAYKPGDGDTQFKASAAANRIRALKGKGSR